MASRSLFQGLRRHAARLASSSQQPLIALNEPSTPGPSCVRCSSSSSAPAPPPPSIRRPETPAPTALRKNAQVLSNFKSLIEQERPDPERLWSAYVALHAADLLSELHWRHHERVLKCLPRPTFRKRLAGGQSSQGAQPPSKDSKRRLFRDRLEMANTALNYSRRVRFVMDKMRVEARWLPKTQHYNEAMHFLHQTGQMDALYSIWQHLVDPANHQPPAAGWKPLRGGKDTPRPKPLAPSERTYNLIVKSISMWFHGPGRRNESLGQKGAARLAASRIAELLADMWERGVHWNTMTLDIAAMVLRNCEDIDGFKRLYRIGFGIDLDQPDMVPMEIVERLQQRAAELPPSSPSSVDGGKGQEGEARFDFILKLPPPSDYTLYNAVAMFASQGDISKMIAAYEVLVSPLPTTPLQRAVIDSGIASAAPSSSFSHLAFFTSTSAPVRSKLSDLPPALPRSQRLTPTRTTFRRLIDGATDTRSWSVALNYANEAVERYKQEVTALEEAIERSDRALDSGSSDVPPLPRPTLHLSTKDLSPLARLAVEEGRRGALDGAMRTIEGIISLKEREMALLARAERAELEFAPPVTPTEVDVEESMWSEAEQYGDGDGDGGGGVGATREEEADEGGISPSSRAAAAAARHLKPRLQATYLQSTIAGLESLLEKMAPKFENLTQLYARRYRKYTRAILKAYHKPWKQRRKEWGQKHGGRVLQRLASGWHQALKRQVMERREAEKKLAKPSPPPPRPRSSLKRKRSRVEIMGKAYVKRLVARKKAAERKKKKKPVLGALGPELEEETEALTRRQRRTHRRRG